MSELDELSQRLDNALKQFPEKRREFHERISQIEKRTVDAAIDASLHDEHGKVKYWQQPHVGSGGGYAAIRPIGAREGGTNGPNGEGAITNYLEGGHRIRPLLQGQRRSRRSRLYVNGRHFYRESRIQLEQKAVQEAERFADELADLVGG